MATQAKFNTVLPSNTIQQGLNYTGISSVYASKLNTFGQAENVMTANDVELSLNTYNPGSTASINIPASYKLLGNMYLKLVVSLKTLLNEPLKAVDSVTYRELYNEQLTATDRIIFSNCANLISSRAPYNYATTGGGGTTDVGTGTLNTGLPMDINFLAYQLIKQFTYRIPGCDRIYIQGIHMLPWLLDKCPTEEEKIKLAMMSGSSQFLYSHNMKQATMKQDLKYLKRRIVDADEPNAKQYLCTEYDDTIADDNPAIVVNTMEDTQFVIYALLPLPWTTIDKERSALYYPSHMTTSALELNIQFQDAAYMKVPPEIGYSGYAVTVKDASLRFTYAQVATLTYYKPPIYKLPCSIPYGFVFPVKDFHQADNCSVNLLGLKNGEITQLQLFMHQQTGGTVSETTTTDDFIQTATSMRYKWRNEPLKNVQIEYAGQIIWKGIDDQYDFMNQFDNRKGWSSFKFPSMLTVKYGASTLEDQNSIIGRSLQYVSVDGGGAVTAGINNAYNIAVTGADPSKYYPSYDRTNVNTAWDRFIANDVGNGPKYDFNNSITPHSDFAVLPRQSLSNFVDISSQALGGSITKGQLVIMHSPNMSMELGLDQYMRSIFSNSFYPTGSTIPLGKTSAWNTVYPGTVAATTMWGMSAGKSSEWFKTNTDYLYGDQFYWTTIPVAEKIDQLRGPRDYNLGADFKDSNLIAKFSGYDALKSTRANIYIQDIVSRVRWDLHLIISITSAFIFNGDRAELMQ